MLSFSSKFTILCGEEETGETLGIMILSSYRKLELIASSVYDFGLFVSAVKNSFHKSPYSQIQRFRSFAGIR